MRFWKAFPQLLLAASALSFEAGAQSRRRENPNDRIVTLREVLRMSSTDDIDFGELHSWTPLGPDAVVAITGRTREIIKVERVKNRLRVGRLGTVPKDLANVATVAAGGDTILVMDIRGVRAVLSRSGALRRPPTTFPGDDPRHCGHLAFTHSLTSNAILALPFYTGKESAQQPHMDLPVILVGASRTSVTCDTLFTFRPGPFVYLLGDRITASYQPLNDGDVVAVSGPWLFFGRRLALRPSDAVSYVIKRVHLGTRVVDSSSRHYKPIRVTAALRDSIRAAALTLLRDVPLSRSELLTSLDSGLYFPQFVPPFSRLIAAPSGALLVERESTSPTANYDVYSASLSFAGQVRLRRNERVVAFGHGSVWVVGGSSESVQLSLYHGPPL